MPASRLAVPPHPANSIFTRIRVLIGKAFFDVDKRPGQEFEVQTPYLAAIVKGTTFSVSVTGQRSRVNVAEGRVGVTALGNGQSVILGPGQSARVTTQPGSGVSTDTLAPGEFDNEAPTDGGAPAEGTPADGAPDGDREQRGEGRGQPEGRDQAKADNPGRGGEASQGRGRPDGGLAPQGPNGQGRQSLNRGRSQGDAIGPGQSARAAARAGNGTSTGRPLAGQGKPDTDREQRGKRGGQTGDTDSDKTDKPGRSKPIVISKSLGSVKLDTSSATDGLVDSVGDKLSPGGEGGTGSPSVFSATLSSISANTHGNGYGNGNGNSNGNGNGNGNGNSNGNGNGKGNGK